MRPPKASPLIALGLTAALFLGGCGVAQPTAATVNDIKIDRDDFEDELQALRDNPELQKSARGSESADASAAALIGTGKKTINARISTRWLTSTIYDAIVQEELDRRKLKPSKADVEAARKVLLSQFGEPAVANAFPKWFQERVVARNARLIALRSDLAGYDLSDAGLQKYFDEHKADFDEVCVAHMLVASKEAADAAEARLRAGEAFGDLAKELSSDQGTAAQGGELGCTSKGRLVPEFEAAAFAATPGVPTEPVETQFGWHIILVKSKQTAALADVKDKVQTAINELGREKFEAFVPKAIRTSDVTVDSRYGTFEAPKDDSDGLPSVVAPIAPTPAEKRPDKSKVTTTTSGEPIEQLG